MLTFLGPDVVEGYTALRARLGQAARATAERHYAWEIVGGGLVEAYEELLDGAGRKSAVVGG